MTLDHPTMNPTPDRILLRNVALSWPLAVGASALLWGGAHAAGAAITGALVVGNLWVLRLLSSKFVEGVARESAATSLWGLALLAKFAVFAGLLLWVGDSVPVLGLAVGFAPLVLGALFTGIEIAIREPADFTVPSDEA